MSTTLDIYLRPQCLCLNELEAAGALSIFGGGVHKLNERDHGTMLDRMVQQYGETFKGLRRQLRYEGSLIVEVTC